MESGKSEKNFKNLERHVQCKNMLSVIDNFREIIYYGGKWKFTYHNIESRPSKVHYAKK